MRQNARFRSSWDSSLGACHWRGPASDHSHWTRVAAAAVGGGVIGHCRHPKVSGLDGRRRGTMGPGNLPGQPAPLQCSIALSLIPDPRQIGDGGGDGPPDPRQIGDGTPIPIPGQIGDGYRGFRAPGGLKWDRISNRTS